MEIGKSALRRMADRVRGFHGNEQGDEGVNKVLIIAMIAIPLIVVLIAFGDQIGEFFAQKWKDLKGGGGVDDSVID